MLAHFVSQFYDRASYVPPLVLLQQPLEESDLIQAVLEEKRAAACASTSPSEERSGGW